MATTTTNLGLTKPSLTDEAVIAVINANMDTIDTQTILSGGDATRKWIKYPDGTMIATGVKTATVNCSTAWGGIYTTGTNTFVFDNFLVPFIAAPIMSYGGGRGGGTGDFFIMTDFAKPPTNTSPGGVQIARGTVNASLTAVVNYTAIGRWKA